jgi:hypothetical protein
MDASVAFSPTSKRKARRTSGCYRIAPDISQVQQDEVLKLVDLEQSNV